MSGYLLCTFCLDLDDVENNIGNFQKSQQKKIQKKSFWEVSYQHTYIFYGKCSDHRDTTKKAGASLQCCHRDEWINTVDNIVMVKMAVTCFVRDTVVVLY